MNNLRRGTIRARMFVFSAAMVLVVSAVLTGYATVSRQLSVSREIAVELVGP
jgi:hypothetical protein